ncbi:Apolipoprotein N-acyltransferase [Saliniradius amylolyticus]|uniref:Apolipoprotein N-acyltransferase n=1 Tax=Saliniradius amylolyticus TaxID=2183582 RepID=A0A2S2E1H2_9ALTE|nr:apolipoprotein N-acyltransferase [Saliniradius amylolyticus]AWL11483.1 Apolipoprotein N-acyltransferase [Saliniradius amylolyticus]
MTTTTPKRKNSRLFHSIAFLSGAGLTLGFAPFSVWALGPLLVLVFLAALAASPRPFWTGFWFGAGWFGVGISWVHVSIADFGGLPLIGSLGLMALLCGYLALYPALFAWLLRRYFCTHLWPLAAPLLWLMTEWLRSWVLTGFPWLSLGYSQLHGPLAGWIPVIGEFGTSALVILTASALVAFTASGRKAYWLMVALLPLVAGSLLKQINWVSPSDRQVDLAMVQGNIKQELRWIPEQDAPTMNKYRQLSQNHWDADLMIWPEAAIPKLEPMAVEYIQALDEQAAITHTGMITGIVNYNFESQQAFNQLIALGSEGGEPQGHYQYQHDNRYAKHHLLPIGEFIPLEDWLRGLAPIFDLPMSSFTRGAYQQKNIIANGYHLAPAICFEIAFPEQIRANLHPGTDLILTVSNDAWFGRSHGPHQHMEIAQVRALELGLPVLRATNNGITGVITPDGRLVQRLPQFEESVLRTEVNLYTGQTPFVRWGSWGSWFMTLVLFAFAWLRRR